MVKTNNKNKNKNKNKEKNKNGKEGSVYSLLLVQDWVVGALLPLGGDAVASRVVDEHSCGPPLQKLYFSFSLSSPSSMFTPDPHYTIHTLWKWNSSVPRSFS